MYSVRIGNQIRELSTPWVMGIVNVTPDSFAEHCADLTAEEILRLASRQIEEGASILDIGGYSTHPHASYVSEEEEWKRVESALSVLRREWADFPLSIDTFRGEIARRSVEDYDVNIINDVSGGMWDSQMLEVVSRARVPYILTHCRWSSPAQGLMDNSGEELVSSVMGYMAERIDCLHQSGVEDVIVDPGFGFGITLEESYVLLNHLRCLKELGCPILVGVSRKSMVYKTLGVTPQEALNGTTALNMIALEGGADILRVHDVRPACEVVSLYEKLHSCR